MKCTVGTNHVHVRFVDLGNSGLCQTSRTTLTVPLLILDHLTFDIFGLQQNTIKFMSINRQGKLMSNDRKLAPEHVALYLQNAPDKSQGKPKNYDL